MDCVKAETAMMHYIEKSLKPADAQGLAAHVQSCEVCRALYLMLDEAADLLTETATLVTAPADFTEGVMEKVRLQPARVHTPNPVLRMLWGLSGIFIGVALLFALNPTWADAVAGASRVAAWVRDGFLALGAYAGELGLRLAQLDMQVLVHSGLGIAALVISLLIAALLYGLHRGENVPQTGLRA